jgi:hypothetical protein
MKDLHSKLKVVSLIDVATLAADSALIAVDRQGYEGVEIVLSIGIGGITFTTSNKVEFVLTHSDDNSSYSNVADADMLGVTGISNGIIKSLVAAHAAASVHRYGYKGNKRYLKLLADFSGTHATGTPIGANALLAAGYNKPEAAQA